MRNKEILAITDGRPGNDSQVIGLANELQNQLDISYKILSLEYNFLVFLPSFFLRNTVLFLKKEARTRVLNYCKPSELIISAGRRGALVAYFLKKKSKNQSKIIQIMNPNLDLKNFDLVILPEHDFPDIKTMGELPKNVVTTTGSLGKINDESIKIEILKHQSEFKDIKGVKIALLIGGNSKNSSFDSESIVNLANISSRVARNMDATLLVMTSRRTGKDNSKLLKANFSCRVVFYDWEDLQGKNLYLAILGVSDFFIVTGDSMSMCSECSSTGKATYIFSENNMSSKKHLRFHKDLFLGNYAKNLTSDTMQLENFGQRKLEETKNVSNLIINRFF